MGGKTGWVLIPSLENDPENFNDNVNKLKSLSYNKTWCTKNNFNAEPYLEKDDFHIYLDNGKLKFCIRIIGDEIQEIQGDRNDDLLPADYYDVAMQHIDKEGLKINKNVASFIQSSKKHIEKIESIKKDLKEEIDITNPREVYEFFEIECTENADGTMSLSEYRQPEDDITFSELGINEVELYKKANIKNIAGDANFFGSQVQNLGNLQTIGGSAIFKYSQVQNLGSLQTIGGGAKFEHSQIRDLTNLQTIGGGANFEHSQVQNLGKLKTIGGSADFGHSQIRDLGNLESIGWNAYFENSQVQNLGNLQTIGGDVYLENSKLTEVDFKNIKVGYEIYA